MADGAQAVSPLRRRVIDDMTLRNLSPAPQRSNLHAVAKFSQYLTAHWIGWGWRMSGPVSLSGIAENFVTGAQPDGLRLALVLWRDAEPDGDPRADRLRPHAAQADDNLRRRIARLGSGQPEGRGY